MNMISVHVSVGIKRYDLQYLDKFPEQKQMLKPNWYLELCIDTHFFIEIITVMNLISNNSPSPL